MFKKMLAVGFGFLLSLILLGLLDVIVGFLYHRNLIPDYPWPITYQISSGEDANKKLISDFLLSEKFKNFHHMNHEFIEKMGSGILYNGSMGDGEQISQDLKIDKGAYFLFKPNLTVQANRKTYSGAEIYNSTYHFDEHSRRQTIQKSQTSSQAQNILMLGCSFTLGTGVNDDQTIASYLAQEKKDFKLYNFGIYGAGANDVLDELKSTDTESRFSDVNKNGGYTIYTAIYDHIERSTCTLKCYRPLYKDWVLKKSNYGWNSELKKLTSTGSFENTRPNLGRFLNFLAQSNLFEYFHINLPPNYTDEQIENYVLMIKEIKNISNEKFKTEFYFTLYPNTYVDWTRLKFFLEKHEIKYFDYSQIDFELLTNKRQNIVFDGHPSALSNALFAQLVAHSLP